MGSPSNSIAKRPYANDYPDSGGSKKRTPSSGREQYGPGSYDTVYRYLCPGRRVGSVIGRGGESIKQLRADTRSRIIIGDSEPGCEERVITIFSSSRVRSEFEDNVNYVCSAQDALFRVHNRIIAESQDNEDSEEARQIVVRLLVPSDQVGCIIGKGGRTIQGIRIETGSQIRIVKNETLPLCAMISDELVQITGEVSVVKRALFQVSCLLHDNPCRSQPLLTSSTPNMYQHADPYMNPLMGTYGGFEGNIEGDWSLNCLDDVSSRIFTLRIICLPKNVGSVIGKGGCIIKQIRQESGALIKIDNSTAEGDDCLITISSREYWEEQFSRTIDAAVLLHPRCSEKSDKESGKFYSTRLLVPKSSIGCLIGNGGAIITELRRSTKANIRILSKEKLPRNASGGDEMVQISGAPERVLDALMEVTTRLRSNIFGKDCPLTWSPVPPTVPHIPLSRDSRSHGHRYSSYSGGYGGSSDLSPSYNYGSYRGSEGGVGGAQRAYGGYFSGCSGSAGLSGQTPVSFNGKHRR